MAVNKVVKSDGTTLIDITGTTAVAADVAEGKVFYSADGTQTTGTATGGGGYTLTTIAPQQTVTPASNGTYYGATLSMSTGLESGADYIITFNGTEYYFTCQLLWGTNYLIGDANYFYGSTGLPYPFGIIWMSGNTATMAVGSGTAVTIKIEKLELTGGGGGDSNIFVIGLAYQNNAFVPDCTFAEYKAAYQAGKDIYIVSTDGIPVGNPNLQSDYVGCAIYFEDSDDTNYFVKTYGFDWSENLSPQTITDQTYYLTNSATAVPADVAQGKIFFNGSGYQVGTASGGSSVKTATGTFTGNGTRQVTISCNFEPDLIYWNSDPGTTASSGTVSGIIARGMMAANRYRNNATSNSHYAVTPITNMNTAGSSYSHRATYENSTVTLYCWSNNARSLFTNNRTYSYTFIKWTS